MPGGLEGAPNLAKSEALGSILKHHYDQGKLIGAICMAPLTFLANNIGFGKRLTCHPLTKNQLKEKYDFVDGGTVIDGNLITSGGPGYVWNYVLKIAAALADEAEVRKVAGLYLLNDFIDNETFQSRN
jgi:putative intracellular protease/amidase